MEIQEISNTTPLQLGRWCYDQKIPIRNWFKFFEAVLSNDTAIATEKIEQFQKSLNLRQNKLKDIKKTFFSNLQDEVYKWISQENIGNLAVSSTPDFSGYDRKLVKVLVEFLEEREIEIEEKIYKIILSSPSSSKKIFLSLHHPGNLEKIVNFRCFTGSNQVGLYPWESSYNKNIVQNKVIFELGAGVGSCGITLGAFCSPLKLFLSDYDEVVLNNLKCNVEINKEKIPETNVFTLDWCKPENIPLNEKFDLILAADCVYDVDVIPHLLKTLNILLNRNKSAKAFLAQTKRNEHTFSIFLTEIEQQKTLNYQKVDFNFLQIKNDFFVPITSLFMNQNPDYSSIAIYRLLSVNS
eukprot:maker-scaffold_14-snap-gene-10.20-mRNA-1 protein AED:0.09 eAED:0.09 QI:93/0.66/0.5/1/1/1/4/0/352